MLVSAFLKTAADQETVARVVLHVGCLGPCELSDSEVRKLLKNVCEKTSSSRNNLRFDEKHDTFTICNEEKKYKYYVTFNQTNKQCVSDVANELNDPENIGRVFISMKIYESTGLHELNSNGQAVQRKQMQFLLKSYSKVVLGCESGKSGKVYVNPSVVTESSFTVSLTEIMKEALKKIREEGTHNEIEGYTDEMKFKIHMSLSVAYGDHKTILTFELQETVMTALQKLAQKTVCVKRVMNALMDLDLDDEQNIFNFEIFSSNTALGLMQKLFQVKNSSCGVEFIGEMANKYIYMLLADWACETSSNVTKDLLSEYDHMGCILLKPVLLNKKSTLTTRRSLLFPAKLIRTQGSSLRAHSAAIEINILSDILFHRRVFAKERIEERNEEGIEEPGKGVDITVVCTREIIDTNCKIDYDPSTNKWSVSSTKMNNDFKGLFECLLFLSSIDELKKSANSALVARLVLHNVDTETISDHVFFQIFKLGDLHDELEYFVLIHNPHGVQFQTIQLVPDDDDNSVTSCSSDSEYVSNGSSSCSSESDASMNSSDYQDSSDDECDHESSDDENDDLLKKIIPTDLGHIKLFDITMTCEDLYSDKIFLLSYLEILLIVSFVTGMPVAVYNTDDTVETICLKQNIIRAVNKTLDTTMSKLGPETTNGKFLKELLKFRSKDHTKDEPTKCTIKKKHIITRIDRSGTALTDEKQVELLVKNVWFLNYLKNLFSSDDNPESTGTVFHELSQKCDNNFFTIEAWNVIKRRHEALQLLSCLLFSYRQECWEPRTYTKPTDFSQVCWPNHFVGGCVKFFCLSAKDQNDITEAKLNKAQQDEILFQQSLKEQNGDKKVENDICEDVADDDKNTTPVQRTLDLKTFTDRVEKAGLVAEVLKNLFNLMERGSCNEETRTYYIDLIAQLFSLAVDKYTTGSSGKCDNHLSAWLFDFSHHLVCESYEPSDAKTRKITALWDIMERTRDKWCGLRKTEQEHFQKTITENPRCDLAAIMKAFFSDEPPKYPVELTTSTENGSDFCDSLKAGVELEDREINGHTVTDLWLRIWFHKHKSPMADWIVMFQQNLEASFTKYMKTLNDADKSIAEEWFKVFKVQQWNIEYLQLPDPTNKNLCMKFLLTFYLLVSFPEMFQLSKNQVKLMLDKFEWDEELAIEVT